MPLLIARILFRILYFAGFFGFFEKFLYKKGYGYWGGALVTAIFFLLATALSLLLFSTKPMELIMQMSSGETLTLLGLLSLLVGLLYVGYFTHVDAPLKKSEAQKQSLAFILSKSADILFQDVLAVLIIFSLLDHFSDNTIVVGIFTVSFVVLHVFLAFFVPLRYGIVFMVASVGAGLLFSSIIVFGWGIAYIYVFHWLFYIICFRYLRDLRTHTISGETI